MPFGIRARGRSTLSIAVLALSAVLLPASASLAASRPGHGDLSPRLAELAKPAVRSAPPARQAGDLGLAASGPGSLLRRGNRVLVEVTFDRGAAAGTDDLRTAGAQIVHVSPRYQTVTVAAKPSELQALSGIPRVASASEVLTPIAAALTCPSGAVVSEGDRQLRAAEARAAFGVDGTGVTVGILSDSFDRATEAADESGPVATHQAEDIAAGDLPGAGGCPGQATPATVLDDSETSGEDEGRAMAHIVHDLAPGAGLAFATAFLGETSFADNIKKLAKSPGEGGAGAEVIVDDVAYPTEPFFQEGPVAVAVREVSEAGVNYFSSAGNNNLINGGRDIASWEAPQFRLATACPTALAALLPYVTQCMDFNPSPSLSDPTFGIRVAAGARLTVDLQWKEPWNGVQTDLDAYLLDKDGNPIFDESGLVGSEFANVVKTQKPFEFLFWENTSGSSQEVQVAIDRYSGPGGGGTESPRVKLALLENGSGVTSTEYQESTEGDVVGPTVFGHNGAADATTVGAIRYNATEAPPESVAPERFSSRGPVTHYFKPVEGAGAADPLPSPQVLEKPDLVATDGGASSFFATCFNHTWRFFGTSASAPHAAAVAALERQAAPLATAAEIKAAMLESAGPVGTFPRPGPAVGAGIVDAGAAIAKLRSEPFSPPSLAPPATPPQNCGSIPEEEPKSEPPPGGGTESGSGSSPGEGRGPGGAVEPAVPATFFLRHPPKTMRTAGLTVAAEFRFGSDQGGATFLCKVDGSPFRACRARLRRRFGLGRHVVRVKARSQSGKVDSSPAVYRFRVEPLG